MKLLLFILLCTAVIPRAAQSVDYEYYEYYYEDEAPVKSSEKSPDYDISELVKAWKEYIREKAATSTTTEAPAYEYYDEPPRRRRPQNTGPRRKRPRPSRPVDYEEYEYETRRKRPRPVEYEYEYEENTAPRRRRPQNTGSRRPSRPVDYDEYEYETGPRRKRPRPVEVVEYECEPRSESYRTPDAKQCDKYYECNIKGEEKELLCPDGLVFDEKSQNCDYPSKVDCGSRTELQTAQPSTNCPRANGFFAWPAEESCQKFWDCRGGTSYLQICPEGVIFDMKVDSCVTPDQSQREECRAEKFLKYDCPNYSAEEPLRFGNHDRLPDPDNCQKFYSCLRDGQPRLGVCPRKTVFNNATGLCDDPKAVQGCESFWKDKEEEEFLDYYDY